MRTPQPSSDAERRPRVLLVDPHEQTRVLVGRLLLDEGCEVVAVPNDAQALVGARREHPTVIVTELSAGTVLSPAAYVTALRRHTPAPVIVHSAVVPGAGEVREWGLWGTVAKGDGLAALIAMIRSAHTAVRGRSAGR